MPIKGRLDGSPRPALVRWTPSPASLAPAHPRHAGHKSASASPSRTAGSGKDGLRRIQWCPGSRWYFITQAEVTRGTHGIPAELGHRFEKGCLSGGRTTATWGVLDFCMKGPSTQAGIPRLLISGVSLGRPYLPSPDGCPMVSSWLHIA